MSTNIALRTGAPQFAADCDPGVDITVPALSPSCGFRNMDVQPFIPSSWFESLPQTPPLHVYGRDTHEIWSGEMGLRNAAEIMTAVTPLY